MRGKHSRDHNGLSVTSVKVQFTGYTKGKKLADAYSAQVKKWLDDTSLEDQFKLYIKKKRSWETWGIRLKNWCTLHHDKPTRVAARKLAVDYWTETVKPMLDARL